jgi:hypothetical protein
MTASISPSKLLISVIISLFLTIPHAIQGQQVKAFRPKTVKPLSSQGAEAYKYVRETTKHHIPHLLNLADPKQYQYVIDIYERSGLTRSNSPQLYRVFDSLRSKGNPGPPVMDPAFSGYPAAATETTDVPNTVPINLVGSFLNSPSNYTASTLSSYPGGSVMTATATLFAYKNASNQWVTFGAGSCQQPVAGTDFWCQASGTLPASVTSPATVTASSVITVTPNSTSSAASDLQSRNKVYSVTAEDSIDTASGCMTAPNYQTNPPACTNTAPVRTTPIAVCWNRSSQQNCDYWYTAPPNPTNFVFPLAGSATFANSVSIFTNNGVPSGTNTLTLNVPAQGGGCVLASSTGASLAGFTVTSVNGGTNNRLNWNFSAANFPNPTQCLGTGGVLTNLNMQVSVVLTNGQFGSFLFSSDTTNTGPPPPYYIPQMNIWWGCLAAGTKISMADGSERAIESFEGDGSEFIRSALGKKVAITATTMGEEKDPLYVITDNKGHTVKLSQNHPVYAGRGLVLAKDLRVNDRLTTLSGPATIISITREQAVGEVWNLRVGSGNLSDRIQPGTSGMFANGILVGDWNAQQAYLLKQAKKPMTTAEVLRKLPPEWRQDYRNYLRLRQGR